MYVTTNNNNKTRQTLSFNDQALIEFARRGELNLMIETIKEGARPDASDEQGRTPIIEAASNGYFQVVSYLLEQSNIDVNSKYCWCNKFINFTVLHAAILGLHLNERYSLFLNNAYFSQLLDSEISKAQNDRKKTILYLLKLTNIDMKAKTTFVGTSDSLFNFQKDTEYDYLDLAGAVDNNLLNILKAECGDN